MRESESAGCMQLACLDIFVDTPTLPPHPTPPSPSQPPPIVGSGVRKNDDKKIKEVFAATVRSEFEALRKEGKLTPNEAAIEALKRAKATMLRG